MVTMMRNILESTVSSLALLSVLSTFTPSLAMEGKDDEQNSALIPVLKPLEQKHFQRVVSDPVDLEDLDPEKPITLFSAEVVHLIFAWLGAKDSQNVQQVCKRWRNLSIEENKSRLLQWKKRDKSDELVQIFTSNFPNFLYAYPIIASKISTNLLPTLYEEDDVSFPNLKLIQKFGAALKANPKSHPFVCRMFLNHIKVWDAPATFLAVTLLTQIPAIQKILQHVEGALDFEPEEFPALAQDPKNHQRLHQTLMALKLLVLSETQTKTSIALYHNVIADFFLAANTGETPLKGHLLWGAYAPYHIHSLVRKNFSSISKYGNDPKLLKKLWTYIENVAPRLATREKCSYLKTLFESYEKQSDKYDIPKILESLPKEDLEALLLPSSEGLTSPFDSFIRFNRHSLAKSILKEYDRRLPQGPLYLINALKLSKVLFFRVELLPKYQEYLLTLFERTPKEFWITGDSSTDPDRWWKENYLKWVLDTYHARGNQEKITEILQSLDMGAMTILLCPPEQNIGSLIEKFIWAGKYPLVKSILAEAEKRAPHHPLHLEMKIKMDRAGFKEK